MFLNLAKIYIDAYQSNPKGGNATDIAEQIQLLPAEQLSRWIDHYWYHQVGGHATDAPDGSFVQLIEQIRVALGHPQVVDDSSHDMAPSGLVAGRLGNPDATNAANRPAPFRLFTDYANATILPPPNRRVWHHLIYAYLIEATGAFDVLGEVARRLVAGESLGVLSRDSIVWARNTEELFFRNPPLYGVAGVTSDLRPSRSVNRRNAYWRMFGMDLPHVIPSGWPGSGRPEDWKAHTAPGVNTDFQEKLVELLRQVWIGLVNAGNTSGPNQVDPNYISLLCRAIGDMLRARRQYGTLAREEYVYVSTMSWFHLTLLNNTPIVRDLQAQSTAPEQRLANLAKKVGMSSAGRSRELFQLCELLSLLLRLIEANVFDTEQAAEGLYDPAGQLGKDMRQIINLWQSATGQRVKDAEGVAPSRVSTQPIRVPSPGTNGTAATVGANGQTPAGVS